MKINGIDLSNLDHSTERDDEIPAIKGRVAHVDADFLAYQIAAVDTEDNPVKLDDMIENFASIADTMRRYCRAEYVSLEFTHPKSTKGDRNDIALLQPYQFSRRDRIRPRKLNKIKFAMGGYDGHRDAAGNRTIRTALWRECEADDALAMWNYRACRARVYTDDTKRKRSDEERMRSVLVSKDKDLLMVPGIHVDWSTGEEYDVSGYGSVFLDKSGSSAKMAGTGTAMFWAQLLRGDPVDDVSGLPRGPHPSTGNWNKVGPGFAVAALEGVTTNTEAYHIVRDYYKEYGRLFGFTDYRDGSAVPWQQALASEMSLLWMRRYPDDPWDCLAWLKKVRALGG